MVAALRPCLMSSPPAGPVQHGVGLVARRPHQAPEQPPHFGYRQRQQVGCFRSPFSTAAARVTVKYACASKASVIWRYQPGQRRTS
jgi:hypothetical protein